MSDSEESLAESRDESELSAWIDEFKRHLEPKQLRQVYDTLKANGFTTRLKLKLIRDDELNIMFTGNEDLPLAAKTLLTYKLNLLREESPLVTKSKPRDRVDIAVKGDTSNKKGVVRALRDQEERLKQQVEEAKSELREIDINIESMNVDIREPAAIGRAKTVCGHCHHRGHRNQATKPCVLNKCTDYTYCAIKDKHPEYFSKLNALKLERRKKENAISEMEGQIKSMEQFSTTSEFQFVKNLTPRMYSVDPTYKTNKCKLMRDVRLLRESLDGKIPPVTTNDDEQLRLLIAKLKKTKGIADDYNSNFAVSEEMSLDRDCLDERIIEKTRNANDDESKPSTSSKMSIDISDMASTKSTDSESKHSRSSSPLRKKHRKKKRKHRRKKAKKKGKTVKRKFEHDSSELTSDEDESVKQKYTFTPHVNPYFTPFMDPYGFCHPSARNTNPLHSAYVHAGMYGTTTDTVCQQLPQSHHFILQGPATVNTASTAGYNAHTSINATPTKAELLSDATSVSQSPTSEKIAQPLLEVGSNPRLDNKYDV